MNNKKSLSIIDQADYWIGEAISRCKNSLNRGFDDGAVESFQEYIDGLGEGLFPIDEDNEETLIEWCKLEEDYIDKFIDVIETFDDHFQTLFLSCSDCISLARRCIEEIRSGEWKEEEEDEDEEDDLAA